MCADVGIADMSDIPLVLGVMTNPSKPAMCGVVHAVGLDYSISPWRPARLEIIAG